MKRDKKRKIILYSSLTGIGLITLASVTAWAVISKKNSQKINNNENPNNKQNNDINKPEVPNIDNKNPNEINEDKKLQIINSDDIFPIIETRDYYDKLNFKDGQPWIDDDMISYIIKNIIGRMTINDGAIKYVIKRENDQNVTIHFIWYSTTKKAYRTYKISTNTI